jgi:hypothetical protein
MVERAHALRKAFLVAGIAALLTFLALVLAGKTWDRFHSRNPTVAATPAKIPAAAPMSFAPINRPKIAAAAAAPEDMWKPAPTEFVKLTSAISLYNARGKEVKQFPVGKRLRVRERAGDKVVIDYLGDEYTIAAGSTVPSE